MTQADGGSIESLVVESEFFGKGHHFAESSFTTLHQLGIVLAGFGSSGFA